MTVPLCLLTLVCLADRLDSKSGRTGHIAQAKMTFGNFKPDRCSHCRLQQGRSHDEERPMQLNATLL